MTLLTLSLAAMSLASPQFGCPLAQGSVSEQRVFTNADLDRMAACRYQTGVQSEVDADPPERASPSQGRTAKSSAPNARRIDRGEADWRAQWRSIDQKARKLRSDARELRQAAEEAPRNPKKQTTGRRSPSLLIGRALRLEAEAKELEDEFQERARREGALPGWLRLQAR